MSRELSQTSVEKALQRTGVTEAAFFLAVVNYVTARLTNSDNVYLSTISSGRSDVRFHQPTACSLTRSRCKPS